MSASAEERFGRTSARRRRFQACEWTLFSTSLPCNAASRARIWDAASAKEIAVLRGHDNSVLSAAFSPDGSRIVTASWDNTARIWDTVSAKEIAVLRGHDNYVSSAAPSAPTGRA